MRRAALGAVSSIVIGTLLLATPAGAQQAGGAARDSAQRADSIARARRARAVRGVVVTASREARSLASVPAAVSLVDSTALTRTRLVNIGDALRAVPGVTAGSLYGTEDVKITARGAGVRSGFGVRGVAVLLDGIPLTEPDGQGRLDLVELGTAERIEVVRGPVSALYGGAAGGGAVNLISRTGADQPGWLVRMLAGQFGTQRGDVEYGAVDGANDLLVAASYSGLEGYRDVSQGTNRRARVLAHVGDAAERRWTLDFAWSLLDQRIPGALTQAEWDARMESAESTNVANRFRRFEERWRAGVRAAQPALGGTLDLWTVVSGRDNTQAIFQYISQSVKRLQVGSQWARGWNALPFAPRVVAGLEWDRTEGPQNNFTNGAGVPITTPLCTNDRTNGVFNPACVIQFAQATSIGAFTQAEASRGPFALTAGVRYDEIRYAIANEIRPNQGLAKTFAQVSPKVALSWQALPTLRTWVSLARGFEVPTATELSTSPDTIRPFNDALGSSSTWMTEVGARGTLGARITFDVAVYTARVDGDFVSRTVSIPGVPVPRSIFENAGTTDRKGVEIAGTLRVTDWLDARGSYAYSENVFAKYLTTVTGPAYTTVPLDASGSRVPGLPLHRGTAELRATLPRGLSVALMTEGQSALFVESTNAGSGIVYQRTSAASAPPAGRQVPFQAVRGAILAHANVTWQVGPTTWFAAVENLGNVRTASNITINASNGRFYYPAPPRTLTAGLTLRFE
ncbi:MAG: TonB-dependent receptor [Gemmatimonadetes bacterium]|nr:TonB-dependent receptor [Gemmatimonadota bacterium]